MVKKKEMTTAVGGLRKELSRSANKSAPTKTGTGEAAAQDAPIMSAGQTGDEHGFHMKDVEHLLKTHGLDAAELNDHWRNFLDELRDLPEKKPLVTLFGAFLLGFLAGRASVK